MKLYNSFASSLKDFRSLVMFLNTAGWIYVEYNLVSYFMEVFNLYLKSNHSEVVTPVIGLGIFQLIGLITIVFQQGAITLVLISKENIKPIKEHGLGWQLRLYIVLGIFFTFVSITFTRLSEGWEKVDTSWGLFFSIYAGIILLGLVIGLFTEFKSSRVVKVHTCKKSLKEEKIIEFEGIQKEADTWIAQHGSGYWHPSINLLSLTEEVGEVAREVNHLFGEKRKREGEPEGNLGQEIVDTIFILVCLANSQNISLSDEWKIMFKEKLYGKDKDRFSKK
jgi:NTP pyrophosphatase (non-canonical NTP hydrolase)